MALLHGAVAADAPPDQVDTLVQREAVAAALRHLGAEPVPVVADLDLAATAARLRAATVDAVFNLVDDLCGQDALAPVAALVAAGCGLPITGAPPAALLACAHKPTVKRLLHAAGLPTPDRDPGHGTSGGGGPWIVKSAWDHASRGLDAEALCPDLDSARRRIGRMTAAYGGEWFAERYVEGRELNVALLDDGGGGARVLAVAEIGFEGLPPGCPRIVGYEAKWRPGSPADLATPRRFVDPQAEPALIARAADLARGCWTLFGLRGYARIDLRVDGSGRCWVIDVNPNPGLAPDAGMAACAAHAGLTYEGLIAHILASAGVSLTGRAAAAAGR
ncbi:D-alanine--D-alanine ligase [Inmirania thermothiophila]|uniref:D-alanine--D-alanine ligase n=1 Tax=Inmirania thermothiophila TaxID=1750597 RepID=UPI00147494C3|nr:D-alanine--D-alanine ligase [Inmirania thermothiophila]